MEIVTAGFGATSNPAIAKLHPSLQAAIAGVAASNAPAGDPIESARAGRRETDMDVPNFEKSFRHFSEVVYPRFGDSRFTSFTDGAARGWEGYKPKLRSLALDRLDPKAWRESQIGTGEILVQALGAIEISGNEQTRNNLVSWEERYGPGSASHSALRAARADPRRRAEFERWFWSAFKEDEPPETLFERFRALAGDGYPLAAYIFFLLDMERFAPIAPRTFDEAFRRLGMPIVTTGRCSWQNYAEYNAAIEAVRLRLAVKPGLGGARHIDAHSFLWMMVRMEEERPGGSQKPGAVRFAGARVRSIFEMAENASRATAQSGKESRFIHKEKQMHHHRQELERIIAKLADAQSGLCSLTGLPLQWRGDHEDDAMLASLDRIDSSGHYVEDNLQIVCRFANQWKSSMPDGEFRRLLSSVRSVTTV
ncbi:hypothetical protein [Sphingosinicella sp.]|uniref:hypothetical protein n=1 Tax=Sphingosinicella sp. TaxID=1917971 RepID=UPI0040376AC8